MKRVLPVLVPLLVVLALLWRQRRESPATDSPGPLPPAGQIAGASVPATPAVSGGGGDPKAYGPPPETRLEEMKVEYLGKFPPTFAKGVRVNATPSAPGIWMLEAEISGARLMSSDARLLQNADGSWKLWEFVAPPVPERTRDFPRVNEAELQELVLAELRKMSAARPRVLLKERRWLPDDADLTPCVAFQVDYENAESNARVEDWCVQPEQKRVIWKRSIGRP